MSVQKVVIIESGVDQATARPYIYGGIYDELLEPVSLNKMELITKSVKGKINFRAILREDEKPVHLLARLAKEYEEILAESCRKTIDLEEICLGLKRLWPEAEYDKW